MKNANQKKKRPAKAGAHSTTNTNPPHKTSKKSSRSLLSRVIALVLAILMVLGVIIAGINSFRY